MKYTTVLLLIVLSLRLSAQQHTSVLFLHRDFEPTASAIDYSFTTGVPVDDDIKCHQSKQMKTAGTILIAGGAGMAVASLGLATGGVFYELTSSDMFVDRKVEAIFISSGVIGGVGLLAVFSGIPTLIVGKVQARDYCDDEIPRHGHHHQAYISTNGTHLALNF